MTTATNAQRTPDITDSLGWDSSCAAVQRSSVCIVYSQPVVSRPTSPAPDVRAIGPYCEAALRRAEVEHLEDGVWYAEVTELPGVWADAADAASCLRTLREVIEEWVVLKLRDGDSDFPPLDGIDLNVH